ncbi:MAG: hypothetical protein AAF211_16255, partial [Myxococcota bacterium]
MPRMMLVALVGCGVQFGSEEPALVELCPDLQTTTVPFGDDAEASAAALTFGERTGTAQTDDGDRALTLTLTSSAGEVERSILLREPTETDRIDGCLDSTAFEGELSLATDDGAFDERFSVRVVVDHATAGVRVEGRIDAQDQGGTWLPSLEAGETLVGLEVLADWTDTVADGEVEGRVEGEDATTAWERGAPALTFTT